MTFPDLTHLLYQIGWASPNRRNCGFGWQTPSQTAALWRSYDTPTRPREGGVFGWWGMVEALGTVSLPCSSQKSQGYCSPCPASERLIEHRHEHELLTAAIRRWRSESENHFSRMPQIPPHIFGRICDIDAVMNSRSAAERWPDAGCYRR